MEKDKNINRPVDFVINIVLLAVEISILLHRNRVSLALGGPSAFAAGLVFEGG